VSALAVVAMVGAGVSSVVAPCVLPLLPVYVTVVLDAAAHGGRTAVLRSALTFVAGFSAVFVALGTAAGAVGATVGATADRVSRVGGLVLVALGVLMLLAASGRVGRQWHLVRALPAAGSRWRPLVLGVAFGAAWTPCVGPLLGTALVAAATADPTVGAGLLAAYSVGLALPFVTVCLLGTATGGLAPGGWLPGLARRFGARAVAWQRVAAVLVVALGALLAIGRVPVLGPDVGFGMVTTSG
jgi:cytochrome c-type biogenesis protein